jgi:cAMP-dependent protein kinase regulator
MGNTNSCCKTNSEEHNEVLVGSNQHLPSNTPTQQPLSEANNKADKSFSDDDDNDQDAIEIAKKVQIRRFSTKKKMGISAEAYGSYNKAKEFTPTVIQKSPEQTAQIRSTLKLNFMFNGLDEKDQEIVINAMNIKTYHTGEHVIRQNDQGNELYILAEGALRCEKIFPGNSEPTFLKNYAPGEVLGELSLLYNTPRAASIISTTESRLFSLDRETFNHIVKNSAVKKRELYETFLKKVHILAGLDNYERSKICDCLKTERFEKGDYIIREGEDGDKFYMIQEGTVDALKIQNGKEERVFQFKENDYFGELALLNNETRKASIRVTSKKAVVASLDKNTFKKLLGPIEDIMKRNSSRYNVANGK